jgi:hypothetical protein
MTESNEELVAANRRIEELLTPEVRERLLAVPGVFHVAVGLKEVDGVATDELCVKTYVREKVPRAELTGEAVPAEVAGVRTDVSEVPEIVFKTGGAKHRPLVGGIQITTGIETLAADGGTEISTGTLGCFATRKADDKPVLLTNWHVATADMDVSKILERTGQILYQPAPGPTARTPDDTYPKPPTNSKNAVATVVLTKITGKVDGAIATIKTCYSCCCNCGVGFKNVIPRLGLGGDDAVAGSAAAVSGEPVRMVGGAGGPQDGKIVTTSYPSYSPTLNGKTYTFTGQIHIAPPAGKTFGPAGDSGSVVVNAARKVVGLFFAGPKDDSFGMANHISDVTSALGIEITGAEASLLAAETADGDELLDRLTEQLTVTETGARLAERIEAHQAELVTLVNHERHVTVVWHRIQGPSWLAALTRSAREPDYRIPAEIAGVTRTDALTRLRDVLAQYGSAELRADVGEYFAELLAAFTANHTIDGLLASWRVDAQIA